MALPVAEAEGPPLPDRSVQVVDGTASSAPLLDGVTGVRPGSARLVLDGLPAGTVLTADGRRATVPQQGTWTIGTDGSTLTFTPFSPRLRQEPTPIRYVAAAEDGGTRDPGVVTVTASIISDMVRAAPFGAPVQFPLAEAEQGVEPASLRLAPISDAASDPVEDDGTRVSVPGQGIWTLDRDRAVVTFTPASADVRAVAPIHLTGTGSAGESAGPALLEVGYPVLSDLSVAEEPRGIAQIDLLEGSRYVRTDSLRLTAAGAPTGSTLAEDGRRLTVPGEGVWTIDQAARTAVFTPDRELVGSPSPVAYTATGLYAEAPASALLVVQYTRTPPVARADDLRGRPGTVLRVDLLANDTPGAASVPLDASTVRLWSAGTADVPQLSSADGTRLVVPDEGEYRVGDDGVLTFTPDEDFRGSSSSVRYVVSDAAGVRVDARISVDISPQAPATSTGVGAGGITTMLDGLRTPRASAPTVFLTCAALLLFAGAISLGIGARMEADRRSL